MWWQTSRFKIDLTVPRIMGIVNLTPDSFFDGGLHNHMTEALRHCEQLLIDGADMLDLGGESTRPGAQPLDVDCELARVLPVVRQAVQWGVPISVDTYKPRVMLAALDLGADIINDIWALRWRDPTDPASPTAQQVVAVHSKCGICLMHMHQQPQTMQLHPMQGHVLAQVILFLEQSAQRLQALGVDHSRIAIDPGIGFGKTPEQNFALLTHQQALLSTGYALVVGWSRKSSLSAMTTPSVPPLAAHERLVPSVVAALLAIQRGAHVVRVHDVKETVQALKVLASTRA